MVGEKFEFNIEPVDFNGRSIYIRNHRIQFADVIELARDTLLVGNLVLHNFEVVRKVEDLYLGIINNDFTFLTNFVKVPQFCYDTFPFVVCSESTEGHGFYLVNVKEATVQHLVKC